MSTERREEGRIQSHKLAAGDRHGLTDMCANATDPCPGYEKNLDESRRVVTKEVDNVIGRSLGQVHLGTRVGGGNRVVSVESSYNCQSLNTFTPHFRLESILKFRARVL